MAAKSKKSAVNKLQEIRNALSVKFVERDEVINGLLVALLAREHLFMLGVPGTGKSALSRALCGAIGGKYWEKVYSKTTAPEELYGPLRLSALKEDKYIRNTENTILDAIIAFCDEIWKSSSACNNTMLPVLNERKFHNSGVMNLPLQMAVMASNELPQGEELSALWDRLALRFVIEPIQDDQNFKSMLGSQGASAMPTITLEELADDQAAAMALEMPDEVLEIIVALRRECARFSLVVSDRKWVQVAKLVRAQAYLRGHDKVLAEDLDILQSVFWNEPAEIPQVRKLVMKHCNPIGELIVEVRDAMIEISTSLKPHVDKTGVEHPVEATTKMEAVSKINKHLKRLVNLKKEYPDNSALLALMNHAEKVKASVQASVLGYE